MIRQASPRKTVDELLAEARARFDRVTPAEAAAAMAVGAILCAAGLPVEPVAPVEGDG